MNASVNVERNSWRLPPDETVQVADPRSKSAQDLTYGEGGHNWRSIIFSLLVIGFVIAGIVTAIYLLGYVDELLYWSGRRLTLDECLRDDLTPHRLPPTWISHEKFVYQADDGSLTLLNTGVNIVTILVSNHTLVRIYTCMPVCSLHLNCINDKLADNTRDAVDAANLAKAQTVKPGESGKLVVERHEYQA